MRVAVVDIGTNSTRLLIADVRDGGIEELDKRSIVTRLGEGVDASGELGEAPQQRVFDVLEQYAAAIDAAGCEARAAVMTSAVRDARNGAAFAALVRDRYGLEGRTLSGDEEANFTFAGATAARPEAAGVLVVDIGGGSTELVVGAHQQVEFHVSTQAGVVRHSERHLASDPPGAGEIRALRDDARAVIEAGAPEDVRGRVREVIAVAGTATSCASIDLALPVYDPTRTEGHVLTLDTLDGLLDRLAALPLAQRRQVTGLQPDRAPTIVAGVAILLEVLDAFGATQVTVSDRDILWGVALDISAR